MNPCITTPLGTTPIDEDLAEQAHLGQSIPAQDPVSAAQFPLQPEKAQREAKSVWIGGGPMPGAATGAAIGAVVAGPVGVVLGGSLGAVASAFGAASAGSIPKLKDPSSADTRKKIERIWNGEKVKVAVVR